MTTTTHAGEHEHHRFQAHHFDTTEQQFQAGKLGMWLFLATEVLFFSGMFCAYAVYRASHPEVFEFAHQYLNTYLGAFNTLVLLASSLSVAWGVRCVQLNKQGGLLANLVFTLACAGIFMGVKSVEYTLKWHEGLLWRGGYTYAAGSHPDLTLAHQQLQSFGMTTLAGGVLFVVLGALVGMGLRKFRGLFFLLAAVGILGSLAAFVLINAPAGESLKNAGQIAMLATYALVAGIASLITACILLGEDRGARWALFAVGATILAIGAGCLGANVYTAWDEAHAHEEHAHAGEHHSPANDPEEEGAVEEGVAADGISIAQDDPDAMTPPLENPMVTFSEVPLAYGGEGEKFPGVFFSIYYAMTGVHAIHIMAGIGVFIWIVYRAAAGHFEPVYYGPVEYVGLYWHLVDLIWIYLFPLLYLI